jgi:putative Holliday junction resolvase
MRFTDFRSPKLYHWVVRILGIDVGDRRVGLAISDPTCTLARPLETLTVVSVSDAIDRLVAIIDRLCGEEGGLDEIVVGLPSRLDGTSTDATARVKTFIEKLQARTGRAIVTTDERLTSHEAEQRLAATERDWRRRKPRLDAAAAAIFLQDYLDRRRT